MALSLVSKDVCYLGLHCWYSGKSNQTASVTNDHHLAIESEPEVMPCNETQSLTASVTNDSTDDLAIESEPEVMLCNVCQFSIILVEAHQPRSLKFPK